MIHRYRKLTNFLFHGNTKQLPLRKYVRPIYYFLESVIIYPILQRYGFEKISSTRPQENRQIDRSRSRFPKKTATNSEAIETRRENSSRWNSTFEYPTRRFPIYSIRYKWQDRRGGEEGRKEGGWHHRTVIRIADATRLTNTLHVGGGIDTIARLISIGNLLLFVYSKNTLLPREGELRGKSRPAGNFSALILPTVRIIYSIPLRNIYISREGYISFPYVCIRC